MNGVCMCTNVKKIYITNTLTQTIKILPNLGLMAPGPPNYIDISRLEIKACPIVRDN